MCTTAWQIGLMCRMRYCDAADALRGWTHTGARAWRKQYTSCVHTPNLVMCAWQVELVLLLNGQQEQEIDASAVAAKMQKTYCTAFYVDPAKAPGA